MIWQYRPFLNPFGLQRNHGFKSRLQSFEIQSKSPDFDFGKDKWRTKTKRQFHVHAAILLETRNVSYVNKTLEKCKRGTYLLNLKLSRQELRCKFDFLLFYYISDFYYIVNSKILKIRSEIFFKTSLVKISST